MYAQYTVQAEDVGVRTDAQESMFRRGILMCKNHRPWADYIRQVAIDHLGSASSWETRMQYNGVDVDDGGGLGSAVPVT
jgi:hypothetical protein